MTAYETMIAANHRMIRGEAISQAEKSAMIDTLLAARTPREQALRFYRGVRFPGNSDNEGRRMYPEFFLPPYNSGRKYETVMPMRPGTHILSANAYELEILRLLHLFAPGDPRVFPMVDATLNRLRTTCFASRDDGLGECFHSSLVVLRFLAAAAPGEGQWMRSRLGVYRRHVEEKRRAWGVYWYYYLCLSELPAAMAIPELLDCQRDLLRRADRTYMTEESSIDPQLRLFVLRNALSRLPEYEYLRNRVPQKKVQGPGYYLDTAPEGLFDRIFAGIGSA